MRTFRQAKPRRRLTPVGRARRRAKWTSLVMMLVFLIFGARLVQFQVLESEQLGQQSVANRTRTAEIPTERAAITDRYGAPLALSVELFHLTADQTQVNDPKALAALITELTQTPEVLETAEALSESEIRERLTGEKRFSYVVKNVPPDVAIQIRERAQEAELTGLYSENTSKRTYPAGRVAANIIGFTGAENQGLAGLEYSFNDVLAGTPGLETYQVSAGQRIPGETTSDPGQPGLGLQLTISKDIQWYAERAIARSVKKTKASSGTIVVMEAATGNLLAMANAPTYDANHPGEVKPKVWRNLAVEQGFEPGSTAKLVTIAAALEEGTVTMDEQMLLKDSIKRGGKTFRDHDPHEPERLTLTGMLAKSSNVGVIRVGEMLGKEKLYEYLRLFGVGERTDLPTPAENAGAIPKPEDWSGTSLPTIAFGQGVSVNAVQAASIFATIANEGIRVKPRLIDSFINEDGVLEQAAASEGGRVVSAETALNVQHMLESVVSEEGTAPGANVAGYRVSGKTGTADRLDPKCGCYRGYTSSFIGFTPADEGGLVIAVILDNPKSEYYGGAVAGPVFHDVMSFALQQQGIAPAGLPAAKLPLTWSKNDAE